MGVAADEIPEEGEKDLTGVVEEGRQGIREGDEGGQVHVDKPFFENGGFDVGGRNA